MSDRVKVEKEYAIMIRGRFHQPDFEITKLRAFSSDHAMYLAKQAGHKNIAEAINTHRNRYKKLSAV